MGIIATFLSATSLTSLTPVTTGSVGEIGVVYSLLSYGKQVPMPVPSPYRGSFYSELADNRVALQVYNLYSENYCYLDGTCDFTLELDSSVYVNGIDNGRIDAQGYTVIDPDYNDENYRWLRSEINLGETAFMFDHPDVFWINDYMMYPAYYTRDTDDGYELEIVNVRIMPEESYSGAYSQRGTVSDGIAAAKNAVSADGTRYDTVRNIHDYICRNSDYGYYGMLQAYTSAPLFNGSKTYVCEGYSKAFKVLCDEFGVPCVLVNGTAYSGGSGGAHMWNYVQMDDGNWYAVDVTWDDQSDGIIYDWFLKGSNTVGGNHTPKKPSGIFGDGSAYETDISYPSLSADDYSGCPVQRNTHSVSSPSEPAASETASVSGTAPENSETTTAADTPTSFSTTATTSTQSGEAEIPIKPSEQDNGLVRTAAVAENAKAETGIYLVGSDGINTVNQILVPVAALILLLLAAGITAVILIRERMLEKKTVLFDDSMKY